MSEKSDLIVDAIKERMISVERYFEKKTLGYMPKVILLVVDEEEGTSRVLSQFDSEEATQLFIESIGQIEQARQAGEN